MGSPFHGVVSLHFLFVLIILAFSAPPCSGRPFGLGLAEGFFTGVGKVVNKIGDGVKDVLHIPRSNTGDDRPTTTTETPGDASSSTEGQGKAIINAPARCPSTHIRVGSTCRRNMG